MCLPQNAFFPRIRDLLVSWKTMQSLIFSTLHPLSLVISATATVVAFVLLCNSRFNFHCYTQCEAMPTQKSARKWCCDLSRLLARKITKGIHLCKPAPLNRPIAGAGIGKWNGNCFSTPCQPCQLYQGDDVGNMPQPHNRHHDINVAEAYHGSFALPNAWWGIW